MRDGIRTIIGVTTLLVFGSWVLHAQAVEWVEPTAIPPSANPPGFVWTRSPSDPAQVGGQFNVAGAGRVGGLFESLGGAVFGSATLDLGSGAGGQNALYGSAKYSGLHANDALLLLQTASDANPPVLTDRLRVNRDGDLVASGDFTVQGCFGPVFLGRTTAGFQGNVGGSPGYISANSRCNGTFDGSHVCTTAEVLNSINCGAIASVGLAETDMWIANLAPSLPTPTNDCVGWTTASSDWWGIKWRFNEDTGGGAFAERCSTSLSFACCR